MKTTTLFIGLGICPLAAAVLIAVCGNAATPDDAPARSVKNLKLQVSPNGRYFMDQNGKPFFYLGDTCWLLFQRPNREELDEYLKDRAAKGFMVIQAYVLRGLARKHPDGNSSLLDATPLIDRDPTRPNEEFFKNVDYVVNRANELGLVMGLVTAKSWHVTDHAEKVFDEKNAYTFGRFLGERYKNNAVIWFPGGDSAPGKYDAVWVAMAKGLKNGSGGSQLVCYHGQGSTSSSMWFHKADWLDFNSIQSGHNFRSDSFAFVSKDYALTPPKPTLDMEPAYENHPTGANKPRVDAHKVRSQAYSAMLAGAAGHGYGALDLFWFYKDADGPFPKNGFQHWRTAMAYEGSRQVGFMRRLFEQRPWHKMVPDQSALASEPGDGPYRLVAARAENRSFVIAYTPQGKPVSIHMDKLNGSPVKAQWYDPRDGTWKAIGQYPAKGIQEFNPPTQGEQDDWVLVLDAKPSAGAQTPRPEINYDESKVPPYTLPNPIVAADGSPVCDAAAWRAKRRPELLEIFAREVYGRTPGSRPAGMHSAVTSADRAALGGKAVRKEITVWFTEKKDGPKMHLLIYQPPGAAGAVAGVSRPEFLRQPGTSPHASSDDFLKDSSG